MDEPFYKFIEDNMEHWVFDYGRYAFPTDWSEEQKYKFIKEDNQIQEKYLEEGPPKDAIIEKNGDTKIIKYKENGSEVTVKQRRNVCTR